MAKIEKPAITLGILFVILIVIIMAARKEPAPTEPTNPTKSTHSSKSYKKPEPYRPASNDCQLVDSLISTGFITKMDEEEIQVNGYLWNNHTSLDGKRNIIYMLHVCYRAAFTLVDNKTGKIYAKYSLIDGIVIE